MTTAAKIDAHLKRANRSNNPNAVRVVVLDGDRALCLNEAMLDTWWAALPSVTKAEIYELTLGDEDERCRFCGCTQNRACEGGCAWLDTNHTVCSARPCAEKYKASLIAWLADGTPVSALPSITACGATFEFLQRNADLTSQPIAAAEQLLPKERSVDAHC